MKNTLQIYVREALDGKAYAFGVLTTENMVFGNLMHHTVNIAKSSGDTLEVSFKPSGNRFSSLDESSDDIESMALDVLLKANIWSQPNNQASGYAGLRDNQKFDFENEELTRAIFVSAFDNNDDILNGGSEALYESTLDNTIGDNFSFSLTKVNLDYSQLTHLDETDILRSPLWTLSDGLTYRLSHAIPHEQISLLARANRELISGVSITNETRHQLALIGMDISYTMNNEFQEYVIHMQRNYKPFNEMETRLLTEVEHNRIYDLGQEFIKNYRLGFAY